MIFKEKPKGIKSKSEVTSGIFQDHREGDQLVTTNQIEHVDALTDQDIKHEPKKILHH